MSIAGVPAEPPSPASRASLRTDVNRQLASWLARHLDVDVVRGSRLYGLTIRDRQLIAELSPGGVRFVAVAEGDPYDLLAGPAVVVRERYDALALIAGGRAFPPDGQPVVVISVMSLDNEPAFFVLGGPSLPVGINDEEPVGGIPQAVRDWRTLPPLRPAA